MNTFVLCSLLPQCLAVKQLDLPSVWCLTAVWCSPLQINLLDSKRSLNVNVYLRQFRTSHVDIVRLLSEGQSGTIGAEKLRGLLKILPEQDEVSTEHTHGQINRLTYTDRHTQTDKHRQTYRHRQTRTQTHTHSHTQTHTYILTHTHTHTDIHTQTQSDTHRHSVTYKHT